MKRKVSGLSAQPGPSNAAAQDLFSDAAETRTRLWHPEALAALPGWLWNSRPSRVLCLVLAVLLGLGLAGNAVTNQVSETWVLVENRVSLARYLDGTATRPFAHRVLMPALVRAVEAGVVRPGLLPAPAREQIAKLCALATATPRASCDNVVAYVLAGGAACFVYLMLIGACAWVMFGLPWLSLAAVVAAYLLANSIIMLRVSHLYDFAVLAAGAALMLAMLAGRPLAFTVLLPVALLSKETLALYIAGFAWTWLGRMPWRDLAGWLAAQVAIFLAVYIAVTRSFRDNPGGAFESYLGGQLRFLADKIDLSAFLLLCVAGVLLFHQFAEKPYVLRRMAVMIPAWCVFFLVGCYPGEIRNVFEILPLLLILSMDTMAVLICGPHVRRLDRASISCSP